MSHDFSMHLQPLASRRGKIKEIYKFICVNFPKSVDGYNAFKYGDHLCFLISSPEARSSVVRKSANSHISILASASAPQGAKVLA